MRQLVINGSIFDSGLNLSDHMVITLSINISPIILQSTIYQNAKPKHYRLHWDKADIAGYDI